jgi:hypothetical protein
MDGAGADDVDATVGLGVIVPFELTPPIVALGVIVRVGLAPHAVTTATRTADAPAVQANAYRRLIGQAYSAQSARLPGRGALLCTRAVGDGSRSRIRHGGSARQGGSTGAEPVVSSRKRSAIGPRAKRRHAACLVLPMERPISVHEWPASRAARTCSVSAFSIRNDSRWRALIESSGERARPMCIAGTSASTHVDDEATIDLTCQADLRSSATPITSGMTWCSAG